MLTAHTVRETGSYTMLVLPMTCHFLPLVTHQDTERTLLKYLICVAGADPHSSITPDATTHLVRLKLLNRTLHLRVQTTDHTRVSHCGALPVPTVSMEARIAASSVCTSVHV